MKIDVVLGLQHGDEAKAKCAYSIVKDQIKPYDYVVRFNGGPNAGHTIYHNGEKFVTHQIPVGVFFDIPSIIGPCSVVDIGKLMDEIKEVSEFLGKNINHLISIDKRTHIIKQNHKEKDSTGSVIGSTKSGIAYAYADKHERIGHRYGNYVKSGYTIRIDDYKMPNVIDILDILYNSNSNKILFEGAQGFNLDIDFGDYPYVTSSHCGIAGVIASGVRPDMINDVYGIAKIYETYVGNKVFQNNEDKTLFELQEVGQEIGATTGRKRQTSYLNLSKLKENILINQVNILIINKTDILEKVGVYKFEYDGIFYSYSSLIEMEKAIKEQLIDCNIQIIFSNNPYTII